jgi:hypothetical protein
LHCAVKQYRALMRAHQIAKTLADAFSLTHHLVIPGRAEGAGPESITTGQAD